MPVTHGAINRRQISGIASFWFVCHIQIGYGLFWRYSVSRKNPPWGLVAIFPKRLGIFQPNFTRIFCVPIYARLWLFIQLLATLTKLCHIKHDHPVHTTCSTISRNVRRHFLTFFPNSWEFLVQILLAYYTFLSTLEYKFLFNYLKL